MEKFKKGDKVYITDGSDYYSQGIRKGVKMLGVVVDPYYSDGWLQVQWENGDTNSYQNEDLIHAPEPQTTSGPEQEVTFTVGDRTINYKFSNTFYTAKGANSEIFTLLGMNQSQKHKFCSEAYGYEAGSGDWPTWKYNDKEAPIKIIKAIREEIAKQQPQSKEKDLLEEAKRRYPVGTQYACASSPGCWYTVTEQKFSMPVPDVVWGEVCKGVLYKNGKWAEIVNEGTATTAVGVANISTQASTIVGTFTPQGTVFIDSNHATGLSHIFVENPTQYITAEGAIYSDNHLPQQQTPIILSRTKTKNKIKVL